MKRGKRIRKSECYFGARFAHTKHLLDVIQDPTIYLPRAMAGEYSLRTLSGYGSGRAYAALRTLVGSPISSGSLA